MGKPISTVELAEVLSAIQLIDVRRAPVFDASTQIISGARWRNPESVDAWKGSLEMHRPVVVYCVHGHQVSQRCAAALEHAGFNVRYLEGGFEKWISESRSAMDKPQRSES